MARAIAGTPNDGDVYISCATPPSRTSRLPAHTAELTTYQGSKTPWTAGVLSGVIEVGLVG